MPRQDASDYIRKRRITVINTANSLGDPLKFRLLTRFDTYEPSVQLGAICETCAPEATVGNTFAAQQYAGTKQYYGTTGKPRG
jgi:hypothetical protein